MQVSVACSFPQCSAPVVGQCIGYKGSCGRFYCAEHSLDRLCYDCSRQKLTDEEVERRQKQADEEAKRLFEDYKATVRAIEREAWQKNMPWLWAVVGIPAILVGLTFLLMAAIPPYQAGTDLDGVVTAPLCSSPVVFLALCGWFFIRVNQVEKQAAVAMDETKPEFSAFLKEYRRGRTKEALGILAVVGAAVVAAAVAGAVSDTKSSHETQVEAELGAIRRKLDKLG